MNHMSERFKHKEEPAAEAAPEKGLNPEGKSEATPEVIQQRLEQQGSLLQRAWEKIKGSTEKGEGAEEEAKEGEKSWANLKKKIILYGIAAFIGANAVMGAMPAKAEAGGRHHDSGYRNEVVVDVVGVGIGVVLGGIIGYGAGRASQQRQEQKRPEVIIVQQQQKQERQEKMSPELKKALEGLGQVKAREDYRPGKTMNASVVEGYIAESLGDQIAAKEEARLVAVGAYVKTWIEQDQQARGGRR